jgi:DNA-binding CsgD family transcriptional regulator
MDRNVRNRVEEPRPLIYTAAHLSSFTFPPQRWAVAGLVTTGVTILVGRPKVGKSWFALGLGVAVASGAPVLGDMPATVGSVLVLSLEDTLRRMQARLGRLLPGFEYPETLHLAVDWRPLHQGGLEDLEVFVDEHPETRLVVIDPLASVWPEGSGDTPYQRDYAAIRVLKTFADERDLAVVGVHHQRKSGGTDVLDTVVGSVGVTAAPDAIMVLERQRSDHMGRLRVIGRDVDGYDRRVAFDPETGRWTIHGASDSPPQAQILPPVENRLLHLLKETDGSLTPARIANLLDANPNTVRSLLSRLTVEGKTRRVGRGQYANAGATAIS